MGKNHDDVVDVIEFYNGWLNSGDNLKMKKKNARILFNKVDGKIQEIIVAEFDKELAKKEFHWHEGKLTRISRERQESNKTCGTWPMGLYNYFISDFGNCNEWWNEVNVYAAIMIFLAKNEFADHEIMARFIGNELTKIEEINKEFVDYLQKVPNYSLS